MTGTTILLVEDDPDDAALTLHALKRNNIGNVFVVRDGVEALDFLYCQNAYADRDAHDLPKLILLDINMPKMDGLEVLRRLRADQHTRLLPVVILTSSNEEQDLIEGYKSRVNSFIQKPVDLDQFAGAVSELGLYWLGLNEEPPSNKD